MSDGYKNGAFALGLVTGIGLALNLFLWLDFKAQRQSDQSADANNEGGKSEIGEFWDWLIGTFVSPSDTLAQWIMAILTIAAGAPRGIDARVFIIRSKTHDDIGPMPHVLMDYRHFNRIE